MKGNYMKLLDYLAYSVVQPANTQRKAL